MGRPCTVCNHEKRVEIDAALAGGESYRNVANRFGTTPSSVNRHQAHIPQALVKAQQSAQVARADGLLGEVQRLRDEAQRLGKLAEEAKNFTAALQAIREQTRIIELLAELAKEAAKNAPPSSDETDMSGLTEAQLEALAALEVKSAS